MSRLKSKKMISYNDDIKVVDDPIDDDVRSLEITDSLKDGEFETISDRSERQRNMKNMNLVNTMIASKNLNHFMKYSRSLPGDAKLFDNDKHRLVKGCRKNDQLIIAGTGPNMKETVDVMDKIDAW